MVARLCGVGKTGTPLPLSLAMGGIAATIRDVLNELTVGPTKYKPVEQNCHFLGHEISRVLELHRRNQRGS